MANKSARYFMERYGLRRTRRAPVPRMDPCAQGIHSLTLAPPRPEPGHLFDAGIEPRTADTGATMPWPYGVVE